MRQLVFVLAVLAGATVVGSPTQAQNSVVSAVVPALEAQRIAAS